MVKNKEYWDNFYKSNLPKTLSTHSDFSTFVLEKVLDIPKSKELSLVDLGCGNGKDTVFFVNNKIDAEGIDLSIDSDLPYIKQDDALSISKPYDIYYLRFFIHTLIEEDVDKLFSNIFNTMKQSSLIFLETRSSKGITNQPYSETNFRSSIGEEHHRTLYSLDYLSSKVNEYFDIEFSVEQQGLAIFREDDPYIIRIIARKKEN
tara:strand:+ start:4262 stop:4873 length:612 start_codon:yes stop_codon:yes gene_type:complete